MAAAKPAPSDYWQTPTLTTRLATRLYNRRATPRTKTPQNAIKVVCISDTHNQQLELPDGDLLIHAGDLSAQGTLAELQAQLDWLNSLPHRHKVVIGGNHDRLLDPKFEEKFPGVLPASSSLSELQWGSLVYLNDSSITLQFSTGRDLKIYGNPLVPSGGNWAFLYPRTQDIWYKAIPDDAELVISHGPPKWHSDANLRGEHSGCPHLLRELKRVKPKLVVCGHIHEANGEERLVFDQVENIWERIMESNGASGSLVGLASRLLWRNVKSLLRMESRSTKVVNAAVVHGGPLRGPERTVEYCPVVCLL